MRATLIEEKPLEFRPITIELEIDSKTDLIDLWVRTNLATTKINSLVSSEDKERGLKANSHSVTNLWKVLNDIVEARGYFD